MTELEKLEQRILEESRRFPEVSFAKLSRIAKHFYDFGKQERFVEPQGLEEAAEEIANKHGFVKHPSCKPAKYSYQAVRDVFIEAAIAGAKWMFEKAPSEQAIAYVKAFHSASEVSEFQAAMNIAAAKAFDAGAKWQKEQKHIEWSEEDEKHREWILECLASGERKVPEYADQYHSAFNWLKSLKDRIKREEKQ